MVNRHHKTGGLLPVLAFDPESDLFFCDDQTLGFGFLCQPLAGGDEKTENRLVIRRRASNTKRIVVNSNSRSTSSTSAATVAAELGNSISGVIPTVSGRGSTTGVKNVSVCSWVRRFQLAVKVRVHSGEGR